MNNKYEQLVEYIINDETDKARKLFHQIVVEKSRDLYESLCADDEDMKEMGGNPVSNLVDEVSMDEEGLSEEDEEMDFDSEEGEEDEDGMDQDMDHVMGDEEGELEDRVMDLEAALDELKAEFDALMADEENEPEHHDDMEDPEFDHESDEDDDHEKFFEGEEDEEEDEEDLEESMVREYVEKVADTGQRSESGKMTGTGAKTPAMGGKQTKSTVASGNNMGGSKVDFTKGGASNEDGSRPAKHPAPKGTLVNNPQNKPGANAGKTAFKTKEAMQGGSEGKLAGADGSRPINKTSVIKSTPR
jgi:hypothetical protein